MIEITLLKKGKESFYFAAPSKARTYKNGDIRVQFSIPGPDPFFMRDLVIHISKDGRLSVTPASKRTGPIFELRPRSECSFYSGDDALHMYVGGVKQENCPEGYSYSTDYSIHRQGVTVRDSMLKIFIRR